MLVFSCMLGIFLVIMLFWLWKVVEFLMCFDKIKKNRVVVLKDIVFVIKLVIDNTKEDIIVWQKYKIW